MVDMARTTQGRNEDVEGAPEDRRDAYPVYQEVVNRLEEVFVAVRENRSFDVTAMNPLVGRMIGLLREGDALFQLVIQGRYEPSSLEMHSVNVAIIALKIGMKLGYDEGELVALGLAALFHDVGMALVPRSVIEKQGGLSRQEHDLIRRHPEEGAAVLARVVGPELSWLPEIVVQEQERMDGSGYPSGLRGDEVHEMAYIIGLADSFDAMIHHRAYRDGLALFRALQELIQERNKQFPMRIVRALVSAISVFPLGSLVRLNTQEIGRVIRTSTTHPTRPVVRIEQDARGHRTPGQRVVDLVEDPMIYVVDPAVEEEELEGSR